MRKIFFAVVTLLSIALAENPVFGQTFLLLKDINSGSGDSDPDAYATPVVMNDIVYFVADNGINGDELWKSDGTATGTVMVKDIFPGLQASFPQLLTVMNGFVYFRANNGALGVELWRSDGTAAGTTMIKDIFPGFKTSSDPTSLTVFGNTLYFAATNGETANGKELWKTDGTSAGTVMVRDIYPGINGSNPANLHISYDKLYFMANDGFKGPELWTSDGTSAGTTLVKDFETGSIGSSPKILVEANGKIFVVATTSVYGKELWVSKGTIAPAPPLNNSLVKEILSGVTVYPNPVQDEIIVSISLDKKEKVKWQLSDNNGRVIKGGDYNLSAGSNRVSIDASGLSAGNYIVNLMGGDVKQAIKVIKQ
jgi:ELWxxDGT repeat protein